MLLRVVVGLWLDTVGVHLVGASFVALSEHDPGLWLQVVRSLGG